MSLQAAIDLLIRSACREETDRYTPAVAVLDAANQLIGKNPLEHLHLMMACEICQDIRALIESLPDKSDKE